MSGRVKYLNKREENERMGILFSMKLGFLSSVAVILSLALDAISLFISIKGISVVVGMVELALCVWAFWGKGFDVLFEKVTNKELFRQIMDSCAMSAVFTFIIERSFLPLVKDNFYDKLVLLYIITVFLALPIIAFIIVFKKKEWHYNVN